MKKLLSYVCAIMLILGCSTPIFASGAGVTVNTTSATIIELSQIDGDITIKDDGLYVGTDHIETKLNSNGYEFTGTSTDKTIIVDEGVTTTLTLNNVNMSSVKGGSNNYRSCIKVTRSNTTLNIKGTNTLEYDSLSTRDAAPNNEGCCIQKDGQGGELIIEGNGTLNVTGKNWHATSIGNAYGAVYSGAPNHLKDAGFYDLTIRGGVTVNSQGGKHAPGIGASCWSSNWDAKASNIIIEGEGTTVNAVGGECCAGIGSGHGAEVDGIYIKDGATVTATGGAKSPGIGSGGTIYSDYPGTWAKLNVQNIVISGGNTKVTAFGDEATKMPGIGSGKTPDGKVGTVTNVAAAPEKNYQGYVKYGSSDEDCAFSTADPETPFKLKEDFGEYLQGQIKEGNNVFYTQIYFGKYKDNNALSDLAEISVNDTCSKTGGKAWTIDQLMNICKLEGHDVNADALDLTSFTYDEDQLATINDNKTSGKVGDFPLTYTYKYNNEVGDEIVLKVTSTVSLRDNGTDIATTNKSIGIAGNDGIHTTGGVAFTDSDLINLCDIKANDSLSRNIIQKDKDGSLTYEGLEIDEAQKKAINDAKTNRETGNFPLTFKYTDPDTNEVVTTTQIVSLRDYGTVDVDYGDPENGANVYVLKSDGKTWNKDGIIKVTDPKAKDSNGNTVTNLVANPDDIKEIIDTRKNKGQGKFDVRYTYEDIDGSIVEFHGQVILYNEALPIIKSNDAIISITDAKNISGQDDIDTYLDPYVVDANEKKQPYDEVIPENPTDIDNIKNGVEGTYKFTYKYTYEDLKNPGTYLTIEHVSYLTVKNKTTISATDTTVSITESKQYTDVKDLITVMGGEVELEDGSKVKPDTVVVDPDDWTDITNGVEGDYQVTFKYTDEFNKVHEVTKTLTVTDKTVITATNITMSSTNSKKLTDPTELVELMSGKVTLDDGTITTPSGIEVDDDDWKNIQAGKAGTYNITFTTTNTKGELVSITKTLTITDKTVITGNNIILTPEEGKNITEITDLIDKMNAVVTLDDGTTVKPDTVICDDFNKIKEGIPGIYQVTFTYTDENGKVYSVIRTITISNKVVETKTEANIKTGDNTNVYPYIALGVVALLILIFILIKKIKK